MPSLWTLTSPSPAYGLSQTFVLSYLSFIGTWDRPSGCRILTNVVRSLLFILYHSSSIHVCTCMVFDGGNTNVGCTIDEYLSEISHWLELCPELWAYGASYSGHVFAIGRVVLQLNGSVKLFVALWNPVFDSPFLHLSSLWHTKTTATVRARV